jgi:hypothetical protein
MELKMQVIVIALNVALVFAVLSLGLWFVTSSFLNMARTALLGRKNPVSAKTGMLKRREAELAATDPGHAV